MSKMQALNKEKEYERSMKSLDKHPVFVYASSPNLIHTKGYDCSTKAKLYLFSPVDDSSMKLELREKENTHIFCNVYIALLSHLSDIYRRKNIYTNTAQRHAQAQMRMS